MQTPKVGSCQAGTNASLHFGMIPKKTKDIKKFLQFVDHLSPRGSDTNNNIRKMLNALQEHNSVINTIKIGKNKLLAPEFRLGFKLPPDFTKTRTKKDWVVGEIDWVVGEKIKDANKEGGKWTKAIQITDDADKVLEKLGNYYARSEKLNEII